MALFAWPLEFNRIRQQARNHTFGMVRNGGAKAHQGWDLEAKPLTSCYAVADGEITKSFVAATSTYGKWIELKFEHPKLGTLYAVYCHLSIIFVQEGQMVRRGDEIGLTGNTGNASTMTGADQHLHFEVRTVTGLMPQGLAGRLDPAVLYGGHTPIYTAFYDGHGSKVTRAGEGLKMRDANVREGIK